MIGQAFTRSGTSQIQVPSVHDDGVMSKLRRISITLPEDLIETIKADVDRGEARSVSSYIASHLERGMIMDGTAQSVSPNSGADRVGRSTV